MSHYVSSTITNYTSHRYSFFFLSRRPPPPRPTLFPYTTLFRSRTRSWRGSTAARPRSRTRHGSRASGCRWSRQPEALRSEEHTSELQSRRDLVCRLLLEKKKKEIQTTSASLILSH